MAAFAALVFRPSAAFWTIRFRTLLWKVLGKNSMIVAFQVWIEEDEMRCFRGILSPLLSKSPKHADIGNRFRSHYARNRFLMSLLCYRSHDSQHDDKETQTIKAC